jgi:glycosyltransferase involved in cell wall biosynthesis
MSATILFVFTKHFPYGTAEQYLVDELPYLSRGFEKVVFIPAEIFDNKNQHQRSVPENCEVLLLNQEGEKIKSSKKWGEIFSVFFDEWKRCRSKSWFWKERKRYKSVLLHQSHLASVMSEIIREHYSKYTPAFYAYWIHNSSIMLGLMKRRGEIKGFVCRGHSIDLYEWDWALTRYIKILPFYNFIVHQAQHIFAISKHGSDYLKRRFPSMKEKFSFSRLGVSDLGINPFHADAKFTIVSCSNFTDNKNIPRIAEVILNLKTSVRWIHFGDGKGKEKVEEQIKKLPATTSAELRGFVPNVEIRNFYKTETVNLVINLSEAEGIPVSLMEAISFGIPVLATDVYGNPEVANETTGFTIPYASDNLKIAAIIDDFAVNIEIQRQKRLSARNFFLSTFAASENYKAFVSELRKLQ